MKKSILITYLAAIVLPISCDIWESGVVDKEVCRLYYSEYLDNLSLYIEYSPGYYIENYTYGQLYDTEPLHTIRVNFDYNKDKYHADLNRSNARKGALREFNERLLKCPMEDGSTDLYTTSSIRGKVTVTSDVSLFGEVPGSDLSEYFYIPNTPVNKHITLIKSPDYSIVYPRGSEKPSTIKEYYFNGLIFSQSRIVFKGKPTTGIKSAEITMNIPVEEILYLEAFGIDGSYDERKVSKRTRTLQGTVNLTF